MNVDTIASIAGPGHTGSSQKPTIGRRVPVILALLVVLGPAAMDLYLPVLPALAGRTGR